MAIFCASLGFLLHWFEILINLMILVDDENIWLEDIRILREVSDIIAILAKVTEFSKNGFECLPISIREKSPMQSSQNELVCWKINCCLYQEMKLPWIFCACLFRLHNLFGTAGDF